MLIILPAIIILVALLVFAIRKFMGKQTKLTVGQKIIFLLLFIILVWAIYEFLFVYHIHFEF